MFNWFERTAEMGLTQRKTNSSADEPCESISFRTFRCTLIGSFLCAVYALQAQANGGSHPL